MTQTESQVEPERQMEGQIEREPERDSDSEETNAAKRRRVEGTSERTPVMRGRAGYRSGELTTIPQGVSVTHATGDSVTNAPKAILYANFLGLEPMQERQVYKYRVDFEPDIEACSLRRRIFSEAARTIFGEDNKPQFDGYSDARCCFKTQQRSSSLMVDDPRDKLKKIEVKVRGVGTVVWGSFEMLRLYNLHMKDFLKAMGYFCVGNAGAYVHNEAATPVGNNNELAIIRGFRTAANIHEEGRICMNLEPCHKIMQKKNVLQYMLQIRDQLGNRGDLQTALKTALVGKLVVTGYNKFVYRVEDLDFGSNPTSKFKKKNGEEIEYREYFKTAHQINLKDVEQPLLVAINNNRRKASQQAAAEADFSVKLIPELCNLAGLTERQRTDNRLKLDMIRACQVAPNDRVKHMSEFLKRLNSNNSIKEKLKSWGYKYEESPVEIEGRILPKQQIGIGRSEKGATRDWPKVTFEANFDSIVGREKINVAPELSACHVVISRSSAQQEDMLFKKLKFGMNKIGLNVENLIPVRVKEGDAAHFFVQYLKQIPTNAKVVIVILPNQDKEKYDAVKKYCSLDRGIVSQVVTAKLLTDDRKSGGAVTKIGIQIAAKLGGEPWRLNLPMKNTMICGYDTYHDTLHKGRSFGAFVATTNARYTQFWSKADKHDKLDELSTQLATNVGRAMEKFKELHDSKQYPARIVIYRDGVSDGQIESLINVELKEVKNKILQLNEDCRLSFVIVNKRIGARFYMRQGEENFSNPPPGTVIDTVATRKERFDFYLVSQHTRHGTVTPTYYNIIHENSALNAERHQILAYTMCYLYFNWTGSVRVPAVCQYAHKLAYLCGEHLHASPNATLDDKLHFL